MFTIHMLADGQVQLVDQRVQPTTTRYVSLESVLEVLQKQIMSSPTLPNGCIQYWRGHGFSVVALQHPAHRREMYMYDDAFQLPVPDTLFLLRVSHNALGEVTLSESAVFAMDGPWHGEATPIYMFPYGNVFEDQTICWGDFHLKLPNFHNIDTIMDIFLGTPFNTDLNGNYQTTEAEHDNLNAFWEQMKDQSQFPSDLLVPFCTYKELPERMQEDLF